MGEEAVLTNVEKEFQKLCRLLRDIFEEIVQAEVCSGRFAAPAWEGDKYIDPRTTFLVLGLCVCLRSTPDLLCLCIITRCDCLLLNTWTPLGSFACICTICTCRGQPCKRCACGNKLHFRRDPRRARAG